MAIDAQPSRPARRGRHRGLWFSLGFVVVAAAAAGGYLLVRSRSAPATEETPVTATVARAPYQVTVSGPGTLAPARTVALSPSVSGRLVRLAAVGDRVVEGAVLAEVDSASFQRAVDDAQLSLSKAEASLAALRAGQAKSEATTASQIAAARTALDSAQRSLDQQTRAAASERTLYQLGGASAAEVQAAEDAQTTAQEALDRARADLDTLLQGQKLQRDADAQDVATSTVSVEQARLALASAQQDLANTVLEAPFAGVVSAADAAVGEQVGTGGSLLTLVDDAKLELDAQVDESDIAQVDVGQSATVALDAVPGRTFAGKVVRIAPTATLVSNIPIFYVTVQIDNADGALRGGMTGQATVVVREVADTFQVPNRAVHSTNGRSVVLVRQPDGSYRPTPVTEVGTAGLNSVLTGDVPDGATVLVSSPAGAGSSTGSLPRTNSGTNGPGEGRPPGAVPFVNPGGGGFRRPRGGSGGAGQRP